MGIRSLHAVFSSVSFLGQPDFGEDDPHPTLKRAEIGAIISIEHFPFAPTDLAEIVRLPQTLTGDVLRHYSRLFHGDSRSQRDGLIDFFLAEHDTAWALDRSSRLEESLDYARTFLNNPLNGDQKLIVHCLWGRHRSVALTTAILLDHCPADSALDIFCALHKICENAPDLRAGELAFIDAYFDRGGELVNTWATNVSRLLCPDREKYREASLILQEKFRGILGPQTPIPTQAPATQSRHLVGLES